MEEILNCNICAEQFNNLKLIPKMLECGHTFCSPCLIKVFINNPSCPNCRVKIKGTESSLPVNYSVLKMVDAYKSKSSSEKEIDTTTEVTKRKDIILKRKTQMTSSMEVLDNCLTKLEKLTSENQRAKRVKRIDSANVKKILNEVDEDLKKTIDVMRCDEIKSSVSILLSNFQNSNKYLTEIYARIHSEEKIFAVHKIDNKTKYGKVSMYENKLFFHSLSLSEVPKDSSLILFDELKQCANSKNFYTFINICCNEKNIPFILIIKMFNETKSQTFIKLCTGEYGLSYKGSTFNNFYDVVGCTSNILKVSDAIKNVYPSSRLIDFNVWKGNDTFYIKKDHIYLYICNGDVGFNILFPGNYIGYNSDDKIFGRVFIPTNLKDCINYKLSSFTKISDCGIVVEV